MRKADTGCGAIKAKSLRIFEFIDRRAYSTFSNSGEMTLMLISKYVRKVWVLSLIAIVTVLMLGLMLASGGVVHGEASAVVKVYWTDRDNATLSVSGVSGATSTQVLVSNTGGRLQDVDLDPSTGVLYFADWGPVGQGGQGSINQLNTDGTGLTTVLNTGDAVHQLALDKTNQIISLDANCTSFLH